jgi:hypothetical protein
MHYARLYSLHLSAQLNAFACVTLALAANTTLISLVTYFSFAVSCEVYAYVFLGSAPGYASSVQRANAPGREDETYST